MGGGTVLILLLSIFLNVEQHIAQSTNVIFFVPTAITAIIVSLKNKNVNIKVAIPITIWGIIGAIVGALISVRINVNILRKSFGIFLIVVAIYETYAYIKEKKRHTSVK